MMNIITVIMHYLKIYTFLIYKIYIVIKYQVYTNRMRVLNKCIRYLYKTSTCLLEIDVKQTYNFYSLQNV